MRKTHLLFIAIIIMATVTAQTPQLVNWQAVARNASGQVIPNQNIAYRFSIRDGSGSGTILYSETQTVLSNQLGLTTHAIGSGTVVQGNFSSLNWGSGDKYLEVEMDATGGTNFTSMGASQLLSVPYALYAGSSPNLAGDVSGAPTANTVTKIQNRNVAATAPNNNEVLKWNGTAWTPAPDAAGGGGFTLPYSNSIANASTAFDITNSGTGGVLKATQSGGNTAAVFGTTSTANTVKDVLKLSHTSAGVNGGSGKGAAILFESESSTAFPLSTGRISSVVENAGSINSTTAGLNFEVLYVAQTLKSGLYINSNGYVGINNTAPNAELDVNGDVRITDGTEAAGKVLTSDANGYASWQTPAVSDTNRANKYLSNLLSPTAVNQDLLPAINDSAKLGSAARQWKRLFLSDGLYVDGARFVWNGGATASYNTLLGRTDNNVITGMNNTIIGDYAGRNTSNGTDNTFVGTDNARANTTGSKNTALGSGAMLANTTGAYNTAIGYRALYSNISSNSNVAVGMLAMYEGASSQRCVAIGDSALYRNNSFANTAVGYLSGFNTTTGGDNTFIGHFSGPLNTTGSQNTFLGSYAGNQSSIANNNTFMGFQSGYKSTAGSNTFLGAYSGSNITTGTDNTYIGRSAGGGLSTSTGSNNVALGSFALAYIQSGYSNVAIGSNALYSNKNRNNTVAVGDSALYNNGSGTPTGGQALQNTAVGSKSLFANTTGAGNTAIGYQSMINNVTGNSNTSVGASALQVNNAGFGNAAMGYQAMYYNTSGGNNVAMGMYALSDNISGNNSVGVGYAAISASKGNGNTGIGYQAGLGITTGANNTVIGNSADVPTGTASNQVRIGNTAVTYAGVQVGWTVTSDKFWKEDIREIDNALPVVKLLRPVDFVRKKVEEEIEKDTEGKASVKKTLTSNPGGTREMGFIAQEVENALLQAGVDNSGIISKDAEGHLGVRYNDFISLLTKAVQELSDKQDQANIQIKELMAANRALRSELQTLKQK